MNTIVLHNSESVVIMPTCEVTYEMGIFDINIHFLYGHPEAIENTIVLLYESFRLFCARYEQYLTFEVEASHDSNCNFLFNSKQDCIGSLTNPLCSYTLSTGRLFYEHMLVVYDIHRLMQNYIESYKDTNSPLITPIYNNTEAQAFYEKCIR